MPIVIEEGYVEKIRDAAQDIKFARSRFSQVVRTRAPAQVVKDRQSKLEQVLSSASQKSASLQLLQPQQLTSHEADTWTHINNLTVKVLENGLVEKLHQKALDYVMVVMNALINTISGLREKITLQTTQIQALNIESNNKEEMIAQLKQEAVQLRRENNKLEQELRSNSREIGVHEGQSQSKQQQGEEQMQLVHGNQQQYMQTFEQFQRLMGGLSLLQASARRLLLPGTPMAPALRIFFDNVLQLGVVERAPDEASDYLFSQQLLSVENGASTGSQVAASGDERSLFQDSGKSDDDASRSESSSSDDEVQAEMPKPRAVNKSAMIGSTMSGAASPAGPKPSTQLNPSASTYANNGVTLFATPNSLTRRGSAGASRITFVGPARAVVSPRGPRAQLKSPAAKPAAAHLTASARRPLNL